MFKNSKDKAKAKRHESVHHQEDNEVATLREETLSKYEQQLQAMKKDSEFLTDQPSRFVPKFGIDEVFIGSILGVGGFCSVREVKTITLDPSLSHLQPEFQVKDGEFHDTETRTYMSKNCTRDEASRYAVKKMKQKFDNEKQRCRGQFDLAIECLYLAHLAHPNIIKMRGFLSCESSVKEPGFFIVLDRLYDTLQEKIDDKWPKEYKSLTGPFGMIGKDKDKLRKLFLDRLIVAHDLSTVFRYLHSKRIIYRDLKPENIGFDIRGDVKLFDFGLCKEMPTTSGKGNVNALYKFTIKTGSIPYMAPECMLGQKYNQKVDVFSFGILLWEMFALKIPFKGFNRYDYIERVCKGPQMRPSTSIKCPSLTKSIIEECWNHDAKNRPDFERIATVIRGDMNDITEGLHASVRDRTTHLLNRSKNSMHARFDSMKKSERIART